MNRRDDLKSLLAAPVAAAVPVEPRTYTLEDILNSPEWKQPVVIECNVVPGHERVVMEFMRPDIHLKMPRLHHEIVSVKHGRSEIRILVLEKGGFGTRTLADSGRRDPKGRRIFA
jgi:hypothetical protein